MSASEKLKTLSERVINGPPGPPGKDDAELFAALPQIVAVVEAAELYFAAHDRGEQGHQAHVRAALAALEEALS